MTHNEPIQLRLDLDGELKQKFNKIKQEKGLENNTDVLRLIITEYAKQLEKEV